MTFGVFKMAFNRCRETKIQTFQYRMIHHILPCNKWLVNSKIKPEKTCNYCTDEDDIQHFLLKCDKANTFRKYWFKWWTYISVLDISNFDHLEECVLFGFPDENKIFKFINLCIRIKK